MRKPHRTEDTGFEPAHPFGISGFQGQRLSSRPIFQNVQRQNTPLNKGITEGTGFEPVHPVGFTDLADQRLNHSANLPKCIQNERIQKHPSYGRYRIRTCASFRTHWLSRPAPFLSANLPMHRLKETMTSKTQVKSNQMVLQQPKKPESLIRTSRKMQDSNLRTLSSSLA